MTPDEPISFYVPARNAEQHLPECIAAVRAQTRQPDELFIVVDPRSQDQTVQIAHNLGVSVLEQTGATLGSARNQAIQAARHRWLASCDSDVFIQPDWLERLAARRGESVIGIGGRTFENILTPYDDWRSIQMPHHWGEYPLRNPFMLVSEVMFDRRALLAIGGYRNDLNYYEDSDLCQRLRDAGYDLTYEPTAIAYHQRSDTIIGLLDLRWKYSEYRQRHLMDRYGDLLRKLHINREYAFNTLSRLLARDREDLAFISFLLYFHHMLSDLRSLQSRRPLLTPAQRTAAETQLLNASLASIERRSPRLAEYVRSALATGLTCADKTPDDNITPNWQSFLQNQNTTAEAFCDELTTPMLSILESSAAYLNQQVTLVDVQRLNKPSFASLQSSLDAMPIQPANVSELVRTIRQTWPDSAGVELVGRAALEEIEGVQRMVTSSDNTGPAVALILRLETQHNPLEAMKEMHDRFTRLVVCYQAPTSFIPGLDTVSASDLASAAVSAGWTIDRFDTLIGRTRLMLSRR